MSVREAAENLRTQAARFDKIAAAIAEPVETPAEFIELESAARILVADLGRVENALSATLQSFEALDSRLDGDTLNTLVQRINAEANEVEKKLDEAGEAFEKLGEELAKSIVGELEDWLSDAADTLGEELSGAVDDVEQAVSEGVERLADTAKQVISDLGDRIEERVAQRARDAGRDIVRGATERAIVEVTETIFTTQTGAMITSSFGPYIPVVIAVQPALPAIQDALDVMRGGL